MTFREPDDLSTTLQRNMSPNYPSGTLSVSMDIQRTHTPVVVSTPDCEECLPDAPRIVTPGEAARAGLRAVLLSTGDGGMRVLRRLQKRRHWALTPEVR
jgi:hypothetical protein